MITIDDRPEEVMKTLRRHAVVSGQMLESYVRDRLIALVRPVDPAVKAEAMAAMARALAADPGPGANMDEVIADLRRLRGD